MNSDPGFLEAYAKVIESEHVPEQDDNNAAIENLNEGLFNYVGMEIGLPCGNDDSLHLAKVTCQILDNEERPLGTRNDNPLLDSRMYEVPRQYHRNLGSQLNN